MTNGHLDVIERAARIFDRVVVAVFRNAGKAPLFDAAERVAMLREVTAGWPGVQVEAAEELTVHFARRQGATVIIKGLRAVSDFENEMKMAQANKWLEDGVETMFMMTAPQYAFLSSSVVKEIASYGERVSGLVPESVAARLRAKFARRGDERQ